MKFQKKYIFIFLLVFFSIALSAYLWPIIKFPLTRNDIFGIYLINNHSPLNDVARYIVFIFIPFSVFLITKLILFKIPFSQFMQSFKSKPENIIVAIGPCISQKNYEVKSDFYEDFVKKSKNNDSFFIKNDKKTFNFDLRGFVNKKFEDYITYLIIGIILEKFKRKQKHPVIMLLGLLMVKKCIAKPMTI